MRQYYGLFKEDDPRRAEAKAWSEGILNETKELATRAYAEMKAGLEKVRKDLEEQMKGLGLEIAENILSASEELKKLGWDLEHLREVLNLRLGQIGDSIVTAGEELEREMKRVRDGFIGLNETLTGGANAGAGAPNMVESADKARVSLDGVKDSADKLAAAFARLEGALPGGTATATARTAAGSSSFRAAPVQGTESFYRNNPALLSQRATGF